LELFDLLVVAPIIFVAALMAVYGIIYLEVISIHIVSWQTKKENSSEKMWGEWRQTTGQDNAPKFAATRWRWRTSQYRLV
jgi:hypothetical protein